MSCRSVCLKAWRVNHCKGKKVVDTLRPCTNCQDVRYMLLLYQTGPFGWLYCLMRPLCVAIRAGLARMAWVHRQAERLRRPVWPLAVLLPDPCHPCAYSACNTP